MALHNLPARACVAALVLLALSSLSAYPLPTHNVPGGVAIASDQGRVDPGKEMNLTVVLKMHDRAGLDKVVEQLYDPASSIYHEWLTDKDFEKYAPTQTEFDTVKNELVRQGFSVVSSDPRRFSIRVHGAAAIVEKAFQTELHTFTYNGGTFQAHVRDAHLAGPAGDLIEAVSGIERHDSRPQLSYVKNPLTGKQVFKMPLKTRQDLTAFAASLTDAPLTKSGIVTWAGSPAATYNGMKYAANGDTDGFTPSQLEAHYGLTSLIRDGYNGAGQTIALVEGYGYPTAEADANAAATLFGLPALTSSNFSIVYPEGKPLNPNAGVLSGWDGEIALDIQSSHAIAPGAKILVVASSGQDNEDQLNSLNYIVSHKLANAVSNSWENDAEIIAGVLEEDAFTSVL
jgi:subtilase family serine protease